MRRIGLALPIVLLLLILSATLAMAPSPQAATPNPSLTPSPTPTPVPAILQRTEAQSPLLVVALVGLVGVVLGALLTPVFKKLGDHLAKSLDRLGSG